MKPTAVTILDKISHVSADKEVEVTCQAVGGYPSPKLTWWLGSKMLRPFDEVRYHMITELGYIYIYIYIYIYEHNIIEYVLSILPPI